MVEDGEIGSDGAIGVVPPSPGVHGTAVPWSLELCMVHACLGRLNCVGMMHYKKSVGSGPHPPLSTPGSGLVCGTGRVGAVGKYSWKVQ